MSLPVEAHRCEGHQPVTLHPLAADDGPKEDTLTITCEGRLRDSSSTTSRLRHPVTLATTYTTVHDVSSKMTAIQLGYRHTADEQAVIEMPTESAKPTEWFIQLPRANTPAHRASDSPRQFTTVHLRQLGYTCNTLHDRSPQFIYDNSVTVCDPLRHPLHDSSRH